MGGYGGDYCKNFRISSFRAATSFSAAMATKSRSQLDSIHSLVTTLARRFLTIGGFASFTFSFLHAVGDDVVLGEAVLELQCLHRLVEMVGQAGKTDSGRVVVQPGLILRTVKMLNEKTKVHRRAINAVHEQHGNFSGIVGLEEVDAGADIENKVIRSP